MKSNFKLKMVVIAAFAILFLLWPQAVHALTSRLYVSNGNDNSVSVVDPSTNNLVASIPVGNEPRTVDASSNRVYVANFTGNSVSVIDKNTNSVISTIPIVEGNPERLTVSNDGSRLYVGDLGPPNVVTVVDTADNNIITTLTGFNHPHSVAVNPSGTRLYVVSNNCCSGENGWVSVLDTSNYSTIATIPVGVEPSHITLTPNSQKAYVTNNGGTSLGNTVSVIDTNTNVVTNTIPVGINPYVVDINSTGTRAYVMNTFYWAGGNTQSVTGKISVIDTATDSVIATVPVGYVPNFVAVSLDDSKIYVTNSISNTLDIIEAATNTVTGSIPVGNNPWGIVESPLLKQITVLNPAKVWLSKGLLNIGVQFDLLAEAYKDNTLVSSGQVNSVQVGSGGFNNASIVNIPFNSFTPIDFPQGSQLKIKLSARNACTGSLLNQGTARLWFNDNQGNSHFGATIGTINNSYYLLDNFILSTTAGAGPRQNIDLQAGAKCSSFKPFGTWIITP